MLRLIICLGLLGHGLMQLLGTLYAFGGVENQWSAAVPWALSSGVTLRSPVGKAFGIIFLLAAIALVAGSYGYWTGKEWFRMALTAGAALSMLAAAPWIKAIPMDQFFPLISIDLAILLALLFRLDIRFGM